MKFSLKMLAVAVSSVVLVACGTVQQTTTNSAVGVNRQQTFSISSEELNAQAALAYKDGMSEAKSKNALDTNPAMLARVKKITNNLIAKAPALRPDAVNWPWEVHVISDKEENAWCMPHGKMAIYSGLIDNLKLTDAEIAQVMAHEISHALREHSREQMSRQQGTGLVAGVLGAVGEAYGVKGASDMASIGAQVGFDLPFSREHETEADLMGMELAARAGYNPNAAISVWDKMLAAGNSGSIEFLSSHPDPQNRKARLQANMAKVMPLYSASAKK